MRVLSKPIKGRTNRHASFVLHCALHSVVASMPLQQIFGHLAPRPEEASPPGPAAVPRRSGITCRADGTGLEKG